MLGYTRVYSSLYKKSLILGVPPKLIALETSSGGILLFVIRNIPLCLMLVVIHIAVAFTIKKESEIVTIIKFLLSIDEKIT